MTHQHNNNTPPISYASLSEITQRKQKLLECIKQDDEQIKTLWRDLFGKSSADTSSFKSALPSKRLAGMLNMGAGIFDGIILGWKLYRKFKKK